MVFENPEISLGNYSSARQPWSRCVVSIGAGQFLWGRWHAGQDILRDAFGRCSELLHNAAATLNRPLPRLEALAIEIDALANWADSLLQRQKSAKLP
jgi:hypothetical protein